MFAYPPATALHRAVPKTKIYAHVPASKRLKALFAAQVAELTWAHKLSPETVNLPARHGITEIQVFEVALKTAELDEAVLQAIDKAIPFPLLFRFIHGDQVCFAASYKRPSDADGSKWIIEACFRTEPQPLAAERPPLPVALDLAGLYEQIIRRHIPLPPRAGESLAQQVARFRAIQTKRQEQRKLETRLGQEIQFNRKVELNAALRVLRSELNALVSPTSRT